MMAAGVARRFGMRDGQSGWRAGVALALWLAGAGCGRPRPADTSGELGRIAVALDRYCLEFSEYPYALADTQVQARLVVYDPAIVWTDRWGGPIEYERHSPSAFTLRSPGPDGRLGTRDDLRNSRGMP